MSGQTRNHKQVLAILLLLKEIQNLLHVLSLDIRTLLAT